MSDDPQQRRDAPSLEEGEAEVHRRTLKDFAPQVDLARRMFNFILRAHGAIGPVTFRHDQATAYVLLVDRSVNSLRCAYDLTLRGYYGQAMTLIRSALEDWFMNKYLQAEPGKAPLLFEGKRMVSTADQARAAGVHDVYTRVYDQQSTIAHPRRLALRMLIDPDERLIRLGPHFDEGIATGTFFELFRGLALTMEFLAWVINNTPAGTADRNLEGAALMDEANSWMTTVRDRVAAEAAALGPAEDETESAGA
jgi:hypothetical protein